MKNIYTARIGKNININKVVSESLERYDLGFLVEFKIIEKGYEDLNVYVQTSRGEFVFKYLANNGDYSKTESDATLFLEKITAGIKVGVSHPEIFKNRENESLTKLHFESETFLIVMAYINDEEGFVSNDLEEIGSLVSKLHSSDFKPEYHYDSWAIPNFKNEFDLKGGLLEEPDRIALEELIAEFESIDLNKLSKRYIHGDILRMNILKSKESLYLIDYSMANYSYRIVDLAVIACDLAFNPDSKNESEANFKVVLDSYLKASILSEYELEVLPLFVKLGHAMHILLATYEIKNREEYNPEDYEWRDLGRVGLAMMQDE